MKRKIHWEFWRDPHNPDPNKEWSSESSWKGRLDPYDENDGTVDDDQVRVVIPTTVGLIPTQVYKSMNRAFDFWIGHADFDLTPAVIEAIESHPGVETLEVLTRYRFRLGIGLAFDSASVRRGLEDALNVSRGSFEVENDRGLVLPPEVLKRVEATMASTREGEPFWALIVLPNGFVYHARGRDAEAVAARLDVYRRVQAAVGGVIYRNEDT